MNLNDDLYKSLSINRVVSIETARCQMLRQKIQRQKHFRNQIIASICLATNDLLRIEKQTKKMKICFLFDCNVKEINPINQPLPLPLECRHLSKAARVNRRDGTTPFVRVRLKQDRPIQFEQ